MFCDAAVANRITVDGVPVDETAYLKPWVEPSRDLFDVTVPAGAVWVMGDNRPRSEDSRYHRSEPYGSFVPLDVVGGRAQAVVWPVSHRAWLGTPDAFDPVGGPSCVS